MLGIPEAVFIVGLLLVFVSLWVNNYNQTAAIIIIVIGGVMAVGGLIYTLFPPESFVHISSDFNKTTQSGEIVKFYSNGTGLLDNGTLVDLKGIFGGCINGSI